MNVRRLDIIIQLAIISTVLVVGLNFVIEGWVIYDSKPVYIAKRDFPLQIPPEDGTMGNLTISTKSPKGFLANRLISNDIVVELSSTHISNSSSIQIVFPKAIVLENRDTPDKDGLIGKKLTLEKKNDNSNIFSGFTYLRYQYGGQFDVKLELINMITDEKLQKDSLEFSYEDVIDIYSTRQAGERYAEHQGKGLAYILVGFAIIVSAPAFTKIVYLVREYKIESKK